MDKLARTNCPCHISACCFAPKLTEVDMADARAAPRTCQCQACRLETGRWEQGSAKVMAGLLGKPRALLSKLPETCSEMPEAQPVANKLCSRIAFVILRNDILAPEPSPPGNLTPSCVIIANICHAQT